MPNRILKESICVSDSIDELTWFEEVMFYRLIVTCDDYGRFDGRIPVIKNRLFPLKDNVTVKAVKEGINKLASVGLVSLYENDGKPYLHLPTWNDHQSVRAKRSRYPAPEESVNTSASTCNHVQANVPVIRIQSESLSESYSEDITRENAPTKHKYGMYENVLLSDEDYQKVQKEFPDDFSERIERLSEYIASTGKKYKSHLATIRSWAKNDRPSYQAKRNEVPKGASGVLGTAELEAIQRVLRED